MNHDRSFMRYVAGALLAGSLSCLAACQPSAQPSSSGTPASSAAAPGPNVPTQAAPTDVVADSTATAFDGAPAVSAAAGTEPADVPAVPSETPLASAPASASDPAAASQPASEDRPPVTNALRASDQASVGETPHRESLFEGWSAPQFALFITGQQAGYIEPCGCTGLTNQKGGLARRQSLHRQLKERGWPLVAVDVGNQVRRFGRQGEIQFQVSAEALKQMGYQAIALGVDDLRLSVGELAAVTLASDGGATPFVSSNAAVLDRELTPTYQVIEAGGRRIGVTSVVSSSLQAKIISSEIVLTSPEDGLKAVVPKLKEARCDLLVLLAQASVAESQELARKFPDFHVVVTSGGTGEPRWQPELVPDTKTVLIEVGLKGMFVGVLGFFDDSQTPWRYQRVPLDARFADSPDMLKLLASYQQQLESLGLDGLGVSPLPHPSGNRFVGSEKCGECHTEAMAKWEESRHAHAFDSLVHPPERSQIARHFDPECLSCHVTGWDPQRMFPYTSGFLSAEQTPALKNTGCENCHGPGSAHVASQEGDASADEKLRASVGMRLRLSDAQKKCEECHDLDNSPNFHAAGAFEKYWKQVEHKGLD
ncbi:MAG: multiheme c-type cytochrome [Pirellulaceae bacterium]